MQFKTLQYSKNDLKINNLFFISSDAHPEVDQINSRKNEVLDAWNNLKAMAVSKQEKLFGAHEIQRFNRDADETIAWITEKDTLIR